VLSQFRASESRQSRADQYVSVSSREVSCFAIVARCRSKFCLVDRCNLTRRRNGHRTRSISRSCFAHLLITTPRAIPFHRRILIDNFPLTAWIFDLERIMLTGVKRINELATANRTKKKARYEPISSCWCDVVRARHSWARRSRCSSDGVQGFASAGVQDYASRRFRSERKAREFAGFRKQKRCSVSAIFGLAQKTNSVTVPRVVACRPV
jgi:hypothetical protein